MRILQILITAILTTVLMQVNITHVHAVPNTPPAGGYTGGLFSIYFKNIVEFNQGNGLGLCPTGRSIVGYTTTAGLTYGTPICAAVPAIQYWTSNNGGSTIYFTGAGNVGINTTTPGTKLDVNGLIHADGNYINVLSYAYNGTPTNGIKIKTNIPWGDSIGMPTIKIEGFDYGGGRSIGLLINWYVWAGNFHGTSNISSYGGYTPDVKLANEGGKVVIFINDRAYYTRFTVSAYDKNIGTNTSMFQGWTTADESITGTNIYTLPYKNNFAGNVGIGTASPSARLHVSAGDNSYALFGPNGSWGGGLYVGATPTRATGQNAQVISTNGNLHLDPAGTSYATYINFYQPGNTYINPSGGNVGIGTTSPSNKLHVTGDIGATGWIGAGCEGACEGGGGYSLMYPNGAIVATTSVTAPSFIGNATTATTSMRNTIEDTRAAQRTPNNYDDYRTSYEFTNQITGLGGWQSAMTLQGWHDGYAAWQIIGPATSSADENWYLRSGINTSWNPIRTIIHSGNIGSQVVSNVTALAGTWDGLNYFRSNKGVSSYLGSNSNYGLQAFSNDGGAAAMSFHRGGYYAVNMGLDPDNVFRIGGWSAAANRWQLDMSGNQTVAGFMRAGTNVYTDQNYGYGLVGLYASTRYQGVYAMGDAYKLAADGSTPGNLYGIAWTHDNVGGQSKAGLGHQALFMANGSTQTAIGNGVWTQGNITSLGSVGIGTTAPTRKLSVEGSMTLRSGDPTIYLRDTDNNAGMIHMNSNLMYFLRGCGNDTESWCTNRNGWWPLYLDMTNSNAYFGADVYAFNYYYNSDKNLKKDIVKIDSALDKINRLNGYYFKWKRDNTASIGVIAQEIEKEFPQIVSKNVDASGETYKTVLYGNLVAPLIEAAKELSAQNQAQDREIEEMRQELAELKKIIQHLEASTQK